MYLCVSGVGVPFAAGGGALDKGNGTETGADAAPSLWELIGGRRPGGHRLLTGYSAEGWRVIIVLVVGIKFVLVRWEPVLLCQRSVILVIYIYMDLHVCAYLLIMRDDWLREGS
jgi:hypothetical protein